MLYLFSFQFSNIINKEQNFTLKILNKNNKMKMLVSGHILHHDHALVVLLCKKIYFPILITYFHFNNLKKTPEEKPNNLLLSVLATTSAPFLT